MSDENNIDEHLIEGHEYDGIKELDHPLPRWWVYLFYTTIIFAVIYFSYYEILGGPSHEEQFQAAMAKIEKNAKAAAPADDTPAVVDIDALLTDKAALAVGKVAFGQFCAACHGQNGEGVIGPNLADQFWIHSQGKYQGIMAAIKKGFPSKGMPPWENVVPKDQHAPLAAYVISLQGTKPANPKAPQGELVE